MPLKLYQSLPSQAEPLCDTKLYVQNQSVLFDDMIGLPSCSLCTVPFPPAIPICCCNCFQVSDYSLEFVSIPAGNSAADSLIAGIFNPLAVATSVLMFESPTIGVPGGNINPYTNLDPGTDVPICGTTIIQEFGSESFSVTCNLADLWLTFGGTYAGSFYMSFSTHSVINLRTGVLTPLGYFFRVLLIISTGSEFLPASDGHSYEFGFAYGAEYTCPINNFNCTGGVFTFNRLLTASRFGSNTWGLISNTGSPNLTGQPITSGIIFNAPSSVTMTATVCP